MVSGSLEKRSALWPMLLLVLLCSALWGSAYPAIKLVFGHWQAAGVEVDFFTRAIFAAVRFVGAGLFLILIARNPLRELRQTPPRIMFYMSATQTVGQYFFFYLGLSLVSGSLAALLEVTGSFWWVLLAPLFLRSPWPGKIQWCLFVIAGLGIALAVYNPGYEHGYPILGTIVLLFAYACGAMGLITFQSLKKTMGARAGTGFSLLFGGLFFAIISFPVWPQIAVLFDGYVIMLTLWLTLVSAVAFSVWNHLTTLYPVNTLAMYRFLIPLFGVTESQLFLQDEKLTAAFAIGSIIAISAMLANQWLMMRRA
jgi:drug/metabolite transporter (DMT)-like permease